MAPRNRTQSIRTPAPLLLSTRRLRNDNEFAWVTGGRPYVERSEGNTQPQDSGVDGLWYSPARPPQNLRPSRRRR